MIHMTMPTLHANEPHKAVYTPNKHMNIIIVRTHLPRPSKWLVPSISLVPSVHCTGTARPPTRYNCCLGLVGSDAVAAAAGCFGGCFFVERGRDNVELARECGALEDKLAAAASLAAASCASYSSHLVRIRLAADRTRGSLSSSSSTTFL